MSRPKVSGTFPLLRRSHSVSPGADRLSLDAAEKCAAALLRVARSTLFVNFGADKREHTPSDVVFLLAAEALVSAGQAQTDPSVAVRGLLGASAALHEGLQNSPHNAPLLLALTSTYGLLCAGSAAFEVRLKCALTCGSVTVLWQADCGSGCGGGCRRGGVIAIMTPLTPSAAGVGDP